MLRIVVLSSAIFGLLFSLLPLRPSPEPPSFFFQWRYPYGLNGQESLERGSPERGSPEKESSEKESPAGWGVGRERRLAGPFFNALLLPQAGKRVIFGSNEERQPIAPDQLAFVPFLGEGYFSYRKIGTDISFYNLQGEELWKKEYHAYPVSDFYGRLVLLVGGDSSQVSIIDYNGIPVGIKSISGTFLTHYCFSARSIKGGLLFSDGAWYLLGAEGKLIASLMASDYKIKGKPGPLNPSPPFYKSCALGPEGKVIALHALIGGKDRILLFSISEEEARLEREVVLPAIYPHLLHIAVNRLGALVAAPDRTLFFRLSATKEDWQKGHDGGGRSLFRPLFSDTNFFLYGEHNMLLATDSSARPFARLLLDIPKDALWRILPGREAGSVALQLPNSLDFFQYGEGEFEDGGEREEISGLRAASLGASSLLVD